MRPHLSAFLTKCREEDFELHLYTQANRQHADACVQAIARHLQDDGWVDPTNVIVAERLARGSGAVVVAKSLDNAKYSCRSVVSADNSRPLEIIIDDNCTLETDVPNPAGHEVVAAGAWAGVDKRNLIVIPEFAPPLDGNDRELLNTWEDIMKAKKAFVKYLQNWRKGFQSLLSSGGVTGGSQGDDAGQGGHPARCAIIRAFYQDSPEACEIPCTPCRCARCPSRWPEPPSMDLIVSDIVQRRLRSMQASPRSPS